MKTDTKKSVQKPKPKTEADKYARLAKLLEGGRTANQIAGTYHLKSVVQAKRLVKYAIKAGFKIETVKGTHAPGNTVGRMPNVYKTAA